MDKNRERRIEDVKDIHGRLDEKEEHAENGDNEVEIRHTMSKRMRQRLAGGHQKQVI